MACKIFYAIHTIYGNYYSPCPAILVLLLSLLPWTLSTALLNILLSHQWFLQRLPAFLCIYRHFYKFRCLLQRDLHLSFIPLSCFNPAGPVPWELPFSSTAELIPARASLGSPFTPCGDFFLRSLCFLSQSKQLFHWGFQHSLFSSFQAAPQASCFSGLLLWVLFFPHFCFSSRLNTGVLNTLDPTT